MTDRKLSELTALTTIANTGSYFTLVDIDEVLEADQNKTITFANMLTDISAVITPTLDQVKVSATDTTAGFLGVKLVAGTSISITPMNDPGNATLEIAYTGVVGGGGGEDYFVDNATLATPLATGSESLAIGPGATATGNDCIQLMAGTNNTASTLQFFNKPLANSNSLLTGYVFTTNYTPATADEVDEHFAAIDTELGNAYTSPLTSQGDLETNDGVNNIRLARGTNGQILIANSLVSEGLEWVDATPLTTTGDLYIYDNAGPDRFPVGFDGQILKVNSAVSAGIEWADESPLTTKGDLYTYDTAIARLPVGADGQTLVADSGEATGLKWEGNFPVVVAEVDSFTTTTVVPNDKELIPIDVTTAAVAVNPTPGITTAGYTFAVVDSRGNAAVNNITVNFSAAGGYQFHGATGNPVINTNNGYARYMYIDINVGFVQI